MLLIKCLSFMSMRVIKVKLNFNFNFNINFNCISNTFSIYSEREVGLRDHLVSIDMIINKIE